MWSPIIRRQDLTTTPVGGTTQRPESTSQSQNSEGAATPRTSNSPSQAISSTEGTTPTSSRTTPTTTNAPTTTQQTSTSVPPTTTRSATSSTETSQLQTSTSSPNTSTSPASQSTTPSTSITATQSEITSTSLPSVTSSTSPPVSTSTGTPLSTASPTVSVSSNLSSSASDTQTSSPTSVSSSPTNLSTSPTSTAVIATSTSNRDTSLSPTPTPTPTPTPVRTSSTTPDRESSTTSDATSSSTLTSVLITTVATLTTIVPTLASSPQGPSGLSARSSKMVGGVVGGTLALLGVLLTLFYISRRRRKIAAIRDAPRLQAPRQMLDADDFDLAEPGPTPYAYGMVGTRANPNASGSIFHEALPGTSTQPSHSYSRSMVSENDPLLAHHMRGESADMDSAPTSSPRESTHFRASSTTGLLYDPNDPFGDPPPQSAGQSSRPHPLAVTKALEARPRGSEQHVYPPSAFRGPAYTSEPLSTSSSVLVHQDAGRIDVQDLSTPPAYGNAPR